MDDLILWSLECQHTTKSNFEGSKPSHKVVEKFCKNRTYHSGVMHSVDSVTCFLYI